MEILERIGYAVCHQLPEKSIFIEGKQLPVCARDTGIYFGSLISLFFILFSRRRRSNSIPVPYISFTFVFFMLLMGVDAVSSYVGFRETTNSIRLLTGLLVGISLPLFMYPILIDNLFEKHDEEHILKSWYELLLLLFLVISSYLLILYFNVQLYYPVAFATVIGIGALHFLLLCTLISFFVFNFNIKSNIKKALLIFPQSFILLFAEFVILTKLHNLVSK
ncbi:MAG: DUF2085 domain-containing protein [Candidatus Cloacimonadota bacterium]|nr:MAG: DUF2085 domain-containing protein [Candidatus Cloacimonadota bacterium]